MIWLLFVHYLQTLLTHLVDDLVLDNGANPTLSKNFFWIAIWRLNLAFSISRTSTSRRDCQHWALIVWRPRERTPGLNKANVTFCCFHPGLFGNVSASSSNRAGGSGGGHHHGGGGHNSGGAGGNRGFNGLVENGDDSRDAPITHKGSSSNKDGDDK